MSKSGDAKMRFEMALSFLDGEEKDVTQAIKWLDKAFEVAEADEVSDFSNQIMEKPDLDSEFREHFAKNIGETMLSAAKEELDKDEPDYAATEALLKELAEDGNAEAQYLLATVYRDAGEPIHNVAKYAEWIQKAAANGSEEAQKTIAREAKQTDAWAEQGLSQGMCMAAMEYASGKTISGLPHEKDVLKAIELYEKAFEAGDVEGATGLAKLYEKGEGIAVDLSKAHEWTLKAAEKGDVTSQLHVGVQFLTGKGAAVDKIAAVKWFRKAADQGSHRAMSYVGDGFKYGWGVDEDVAQAAAWYEKAIVPEVVKLPDGTEFEVDPPTNAFVELAELLLEGKGVEEDAERAVKLLTKAADAGEEKALTTLAGLYLNMDGTETVEKDVEKGLVLLKKAVEQEASLAEYMLGALYIQGEVVERDLSTAKIMLQRAINHGGLPAGVVDDAKTTLEKLDSALSVKNTASTLEEKFQSYMSAATSGDVEAMVEVAHCYQIGFGCEKSVEDALAWNRKAAELGNPEAQLQMGIAYVFADGVEQDWKKAFDWYMKSAMQGNANAQNYIGGAYADGDGVDVDIRAAVDWLWRAAEQNQTAAIRKLRKLGGRGLDEFLECLDPDVDDMKWWKFQRIVSGAQQGDVQSIYDLGDALFCGKNGAREDERASIKWYKMAAERGHVIAQKELGDIYSGNNTIETDNVEALKWYKMAAEHGNALAQYWCADLLESGEGVKHDIEEAKKWYKKAAENGDADAKAALERLG